MTGVISSIFEQRELRTLDQNTAPGLLARGRGIYETATGILVTPLRSLQSTAVLGCVRILSESMAMLPLQTLRRLPGGGKEKAMNHYLWPVLHDIANPEMTSFDLRRLQMVHLNLRGNALAYIELNRRGEITALWPLHPDAVVMLREMQTNRLFYGVEMPEALGQTIPVPAGRAGLAPAGSVRRWRLGAVADRAGQAGGRAGAGHGRIRRQVLWQRRPTGISC